jgi:UDPglucose--hexose-1-phosphate uridylyltransferase
MSEYRTDPFTGRWVVIADERSRRPMPVVAPQRLPRGTPSACPFCPGNETLTGKTVHEEPAAGHGARVVANRYPALRVEESGSRFGAPPRDGRTGLGAHEVVVETPDHEVDFMDLPDEARLAVFRAWRHRARDLLRDLRLGHVIVYKNHEVAAGATLPHAHSQVVATPTPGPRPALEFSRAEEHHRRTGRCLRCDVLADETEAGPRLVATRGRVTAVAPYAARVPFETTITPRGHEGRFEETSDRTLTDLAGLVGTVLRRIRVALDDPAYTLVLHTAARDTSGDSFHWYLEVVPRLVPAAGFEWGTGTFINPTRPEDAAAALRALVDVP